MSFPTRNSGVSVAYTHDYEENIRYTNNNTVNYTTNASDTAFLNIFCGLVLALDHVLDKPEVTLFWRLACSKKSSG